MVMGRHHRALVTRTRNHLIGCVQVTLLKTNATFQLSGKGEKIEEPNLFDSASDSVKELMMDTGNASFEVLIHQLDLCHGHGQRFLVGTNGRKIKVHHDPQIKGAMC